jgi:cell wall-associated NlpC family hydrolase
VRRNWLAKAALTAVALSVPLAGVASNAQAATPGIGQQAAIFHKVHPKKKHKSAKSAKRPKSHRSEKPKKKHDEHYSGKHRGRPSFDEDAATYVKDLEGIPYRYGGTSRAGFDCSGLTQYVYRHFGRRIQRTAEDQFLEFRRIGKRHAWGGDLVFFHVNSNPNSHVYHVGIYEGGDDMVAATTYGEGVQWQNFSWAGDTVTFGTVSH